MAKTPEPEKTAEHQAAHKARIDQLRDVTKTQQETNQAQGR